MKTNRLLILIFIATLMSCENDDTNKKSVLTTLKGQSGLTYNESLSKWGELKSTNGNSYRYKTTFTSWTGFGSDTEFEIIDGVVTSRIYEEYKINETNGQHEIIDSYAETEADLGIHEKGAKPQTIDELYDSCAGEYLIVDQKNNTLYFETDAAGIMTLCGFVSKQCADDCYSGVRIDSFSWI